MLNVFKFMKLDYLVIKKQLLKAILLMIIASAIIVATTDDLNIITFYPLFFAVITISYPFVFSEKNNMDNFYATLAMNKSTVVKGRYGFTIIIALIFGLISAVLAIACSKARNVELNLNSVMLNSIIIIAVTIILAAIQMPMYFKFGYTKARIWTYIPFILIAPIIMLAKYLPAGVIEGIKTFISNIKGNTLIAGILMILASLLILEISVVVSQNLYKQKEN